MEIAKIGVTYNYCLQGQIFYVSVLSLDISKAQIIFRLVIYNKEVGI